MGMRRGPRAQGLGAGGHPEAVGCSSPSCAPFYWTFPEEILLDFVYDKCYCRRAATPKPGPTASARSRSSSGNTSGNQRSPLVILDVRRLGDRDVLLEVARDHAAELFRSAED